MLQAFAEASVDQTTGAVATLAALVVAAGIGIGAGLRGTRRATRSLEEKLDVPDVHLDHGVTRPAGPVIARMEVQLTDLTDKINEVQRSVDSVGGKVEDMQISFAEHRGEHVGVERDVTRLMRRIFNGEPRGTDDPGR